jgi:hypothetical protein
LNSGSIPEWKQFEIAVAEFLRALDPNAKVTHDARLPDLHTGRPRQRDVWVEGTLCQLFQIKVLISCKFTADPLNEQDIDAFNGEFIASHANKGVIYARTGFTEGAIEKAKVLSFSCCRLYANQPPDLPEALFFSTYCSRNQASLVFLEGPDPLWRLTTWSDLFNAPILVGTEHVLGLEVLCAVDERQVDESLEPTKALRGAPAPWLVDVTLAHPAGTVNPLKIRLGGRWRTWVGKTEAYFLNGTYSITDGRFAGSQAGPVIDTWSVDPGPGWTPYDAPEQPPANICHIFIRGKTRESLLELLGPRPIEIVDQGQVVGADPTELLPAGKRIASEGSA